MGLFKRLFGGDVPGTGPPNVGLSRDTGGGIVDEATLASGPFPRSVRVRPVYADYGLRGAWQVVALNDAQSWAAARETLMSEYYKRFGVITFSNGKQTIRWNEFTWRGIRDALQFEHDPSHTGA